MKETGGKASMMDLIEKKLDGKTSSQEAKDTSSKDITSQVANSQVISPQVIRESVRVAYKERPRVSFWSPKVSAIMYCLKKTIPDFSKSAEVTTLLEDALSKKYPELYQLVSDEMKRND
jgi:hypothetical protein